MRDHNINLVEKYGKLKLNYLFPFLSGAMLTLLHSEPPKLCGVLAVLSAKGLILIHDF